MEKRQLSFDVSRGGIQHRLFVRVGDANSRTIIATMHSGGEKLVFSSARIRVLGSDGSQHFSDCEVSENTITYTLTTQDIGEGGEVLCEFVLTSDDAIMTSPRFAVICEKCLFGGEGAESSNEYQAYISALKKIDNISVTAEKGDDAAVVVSENENGGFNLRFTLPKGDSYVMTDLDRAIIAELVIPQIFNYGYYGNDPEGVGYNAPDFLKWQVVFGGIIYLENEEEYKELVRITIASYDSDGASGIYSDLVFYGANNVLIFVGGKIRALWTGCGSGSSDLHNSRGEFIEVDNSLSDAEKEALSKELKAISSIEQTTTSTVSSGENVITVTFADGTKSTFTIRNGSKGYTPVRGTDYWTDADKAEIKSYVDEAILGGAW